jgi:D-amino-acid dehydrogenase
MPRSGPEQGGNRVSRSVVVVGGGLIGLSSALLLAERGCNVTVLDHGELGGGASQGNAGFMCTTLLEPLASPGAVRNALSSLRDPLSPLRVRPRALPGMVGWGLHFSRAATSKRYVAGRRALAALNTRQRTAIDQLVHLGAELTPGPTLLAPYKDAKVAQHYLSTLAPMAEFGVPVPTGLLDGDEMRRIVPALSPAITAGYEISGDHSIDPRAFVMSLVAALRERGATLLEHAPVTSVARNGGRVVSVTTPHGTLPCDEVVLAAGAGMSRVARMFGCRASVVPGQGYNVALPTTPLLTHAVIFEEAHAVATPFADRIRLGGTMEFDGLEPRFDQRRVDAIVASLRTFVDLDFDAATDTWAGGRPMSPDGLPLLGRPSGSSNVVMAGGHGMFGLSLAPATALVVAELITDGRADTDLAPFNPDRFTLRRLVA